MSYDAKCDAKLRMQDNGNCQNFRMLYFPINKFTKDNEKSNMKLY